MASRPSESRSADKGLDHGDDVTDMLFGKILDTLANTDVFSRSTSPSSFIIYAHNNPTKGIAAHAECVGKLIRWLKKLRSRILSDRSPLPPFSDREGGAAAVESIFSNQACLLPSSNRINDIGAIVSVDKVIVCSSSLLKDYYEDAFTFAYVNEIKALYDEFQHETRDRLQNEIRAFVEKQCKKEGFHHVLTELAFVELRRCQGDNNHGIVPIALDEDGLEYLPFLQSSDHYLKLRPEAGLSDLHYLFFNLLQRVYPEEHARINIFRDYYKEARKKLQTTEPVEVRAVINEEISKAQEEWLQRQNAATRHRELGRRGKYHLSSHLNDIPRGSNISSILSNLSTLPYQDRKNRNPERVEGTCEWFTNHRLFQHWKQSKTSCLLWVSADPGCGKSVLARYLVDNVLPITSQRTTCYFFFKDDFEDQRNLQSAMRCILHQLFVQRPALLSDRVLKKFEEDGQLLNSFTELWEILTNAAGSEDAGEIICMLDALDECDERGRSQLAEALTKLYNYENSRSGLKFLLTSRPYSHIQRGFRDLENRQPTIHLSGEDQTEADEISREISIVITAKLKEISARLKLQDEEERILQEELTRFPNRTYLWVYLVFDVIENSIELTKGHLRAIVRKLPQTVEAAYEKILDRSYDVSKAKKLLHIILAAYEPLSLDDMATALAVRENHQSVGELELESEDRFRETVKALCGLFVTIVDFKIYLLHQTAREFLIQYFPADAPDTSSGKVSRNWQNSFCPMKSHCILAEICMWYLRFENSDYGFQYYAAENWIFHFRNAPSDIRRKLALQAERLCDTESNRRLFWGSEFQYNQKGSTTLMVASYFGIEEVVQLLLEKKIDITPKDEVYGRSALSLASEMGHRNVVTLLLGQVTTTKIIAEKLARRPTIVSSRDLQGRTPIWYAAFDGHKDVVEVLLKKNAKVDHRRRRYRSPLLPAAKGGHEAVVRLLLDRGANIEARSAHGVTALSFAAGPGHKSTVRLLLNYGANIEAKDENSRTALIEAARFGRQRTVRLLLDHGANIEAKDSYGRTALIEAARCGSQSTVRLLLDHGANAEAEDSSLIPSLLHPLWVDPCIAPRWIHRTYPAAS